MGLFIRIYLFTLLCICCEAKWGKEALWPVPKLIKAAGYPVEKHRVDTEDDYTLQMHRIPAGRRSARRSGDPSGKGKKAVLVVHGMMGSSGDFVIMGPERSLSYLLADAGYDVWLGNLRGTDYSTHKYLKKSDPNFWEFSFHEHGLYDVPAMMDKVLNVTGLERIMVVGYSMGGTSFFTMMSQRPQYNDNIIAYVGLAPAVYMNNLKSVASFLLKTVNLAAVLRERGVVAIQPEFLRTLMNYVCNLRNPAEDVCVNLIYALVGEDNEQNDLEILPVYMNRFQPVSARQLEHFGKIAITGAFTNWDGSVTSPVRPYQLSNVKVPVSLLYGENDQLVEKSQVMRLAKEMNATGALESIKPACSWPKFNHLDFVFAKDVGKLLNKPLVRHIDELYNKYYVAT